MPASQAEQKKFEQILRRNVVLPLGTGLMSSLLFVIVVLYLISSLRGIQEQQHVMLRTAELGASTADGESGLRGFLITGDPKFLDVMEAAMPRFQAHLAELSSVLAQEAVQRERLRRIEAAYKEWKSFAEETVALRRSDSLAATQKVINGKGKRLTDVLRSELSAAADWEREALQKRVDAIKTAALVLSITYVVILLGFKGSLVYVGRKDLTDLSNRYNEALRNQSRHNEYLQAKAWLREGAGQLAQVFARKPDLNGAVREVLEFLVGYVGGVVGAVYIQEEDGSMRRVAAYGMSADTDARRKQLSPSQNLVSEAAATGRPIALDKVPANYLLVSSGVAEGSPAAVLVAPLSNEGKVNGVLELGLLRPLTPRDTELMEAVSGVIGGSIDAARFRKRQHELLQETQQLNEEMQVQQEELRTANEELEEQSRALRESQANLESQQAELEQTNLQLSEFAERVEQQRDALQAAQGQLEHRALELQRASQYKSEFLANMSHELRTPLNSSLILAKLLADNPQGNLSAEQVKFAQSIYSAGNDLLALINDVLDIAKIEAGKLEIRLENTSITAMADDMRSMFEPLAARKGLSLDVMVAGDVPAGFATDPLRLSQILKNLLSNAIKFTEAGGSVMLHVGRQAPSSLLFEVRDNGIGIDPSQQQLVFEAFRQADSTSSRRYGGTGLGLSISRDLAHLLGGEITVVSQPGQGSSFTLELPLQTGAMPVVAMQAPLAQPASRPAERRPAQPRTTELPSAPRSDGPAAPAFSDDRHQEAQGKRTVLVVEDDVRFAQILFDLAHELGYRCLVAHQAQEGFDLAVQYVPDAVLLDMQLPDDSGLAVLQRLKEDPTTRHIPVHVISVENRAETALAMGAIGYAVKPTSYDELREVFKRLETKLSQKLKRVLLVEDDPRQSDSVARLIADEDVQITAVSQGKEALEALANGVFDCMIIDLMLPDMSGQELLKRMTLGDNRSFPPVIVYTGRNLTRDEEAELMRYSRSIIIKGARSPERLLDEVTLFLHKVESKLSTERQYMLRTVRSRDRAFETRRILLVDDDVRNVFALTSALEQKGAEVVMARNGQEALDKLKQDGAIDLVLMDIMMPVMDGYAATREIRRNPAWQRLPIIAVTAKAMKEDQQKCLDAGANDYLAKPVELDRLFSLIRVWMPKLERI